MAQLELESRAENERLEGGFSEEEGSFPDSPETESSKTTFFRLAEDLIENIRYVDFSLIMKNLEFLRLEYCKHKISARANRAKYYKYKSINLHITRKDKMDGMKRNVTKYVNFVMDIKSLLKRWNASIQAERALRRFVPLPNNHMESRGGLWGVEFYRPEGPVEIMWFDPHGNEVFNDSAARDFPIREGEPVVLPVAQNRIFDWNDNWGVLFQNPDGSIVTKWFTPDGKPLVMDRD